MNIKTTLWVLVLVCIIDSMSFGIMIPLLFKVRQHIGAGKMAARMLTAAFSVSISDCLC